MFCINRDLLLYHVKRANTTYDAIAEELGLDRTTWYRHLREGSMTVAEMHEVIRILHLSVAEAIEIFLCQVGSVNATAIRPQEAANATI